MLAVQLGLAGCGGDSILLPSSGQPAKIEVLRGNGQTGTVGQPLDSSIVVAVTDPGNRPVQDVEVVFVLPPGALIVPNDTVLTNGDGRATVQYTLGTASGEQVVQARAKPVVPSSSLTTTFTATAMPEAAVELVRAAGDSQRAEVSTALEDSLAVQAVDRFGNGVAGIDVSWDPDGGSVSATSVPTGPDGRSAVQRTLGDRPGGYPTTATASELDGSLVSFTATAVAAPIPALVLVTQPSAAATAGVSLAQQPKLQLQDPTGAPLAREDVRVTVAIATGSGSLGGSSVATSDASGRVEFDKLSIRGEPGTRTLIFAAEGFSSVTSSAIVVAPGPPSLDRSSASVPDGTAGATTSISIHLEDDFGTSVEGAAGLISVAVSGANSLSLPVTDQGNGNYSASYTPVHAGADQVDISVSGNQLDHSPFTSNVVPGPASPVTTSAEVTRDGFFIYTITLVITVRDAQDNPVGHGGDHVEVLPSGGPVRDAQDRGDGTYVSAFSTFDPNHPSDIFLNSEALAGNPFHP